MLPAGFPTPQGRTKPWGTGHAIWVAREYIQEPLLVINADDFYGAAAYQTAAGYFDSAAGSQSTDYCMVGYRLRHTVSPHGPVARGLCRTDADGFLTDVVEVAGIQMDAAGEIQAAGDSGRRQRFTGDETVSMNLWGLHAGHFRPVGTPLRPLPPRSGFARRGRILYSRRGRHVDPGKRRPGEGAFHRRRGVDRAQPMPKTRCWWWSGSGP